MRDLSTIMPGCGKGATCSFVLTNESGCFAQENVSGLGETGFFLLVIRDIGLEAVMLEGHECKESPKNRIS